MLPAQVRTNLDCQRLTRMDLDHRQRLERADDGHPHKRMIGGFLPAFVSSDEGLGASCHNLRDFSRSVRRLVLDDLVCKCGIDAYRRPLKREENA